MSWLKKLKQGDKVVISTHKRMYLDEIDRETKDFFIIKGIKYRKDTGYIAGKIDNYLRSRLIQPTDEMISDLDRGRIASILRVTNWSDFDLKTLQEIEKIIKRFKNEKSKNR